MTELTKRPPVSLGTVLRALAKLAAMGLVIRNRKTGTFIADRRSQVGEVFVYRFTDPGAGLLMLHFVQVLEVTVDESNGPRHQALMADWCGSIRIRLLFPASFSPMSMAKSSWTYR